MTDVYDVAPTPLPPPTELERQRKAALCWWIEFLESEVARCGVRLSELMREQAAVHSELVTRLEQLAKHRPAFTPTPEAGPADDAEDLRNGITGP